MASSHQPLRTCVGCGARKPKEELIRIVRRPTSELSIDRTGTMAGRGAYMCRQAACLDRAAKRKSIERSLKVDISKGNQQELLQQLLSVASSES